MKRKIDVALVIYLLLALVMSAVQSVQAGRVNHAALLALANGVGSEGDWQRVTPQDEEFSILTPVAPTLMKYEGNYLPRLDGERVLEQRQYSAYCDDFIFVIDSYRAKRPQKLLKDIEKNSNQRRSFESELKIEGVSVKQYRSNNPQFYGREYSFVTKQHVYQLMLVSHDETNASLEKFLSALTLGDNISQAASGEVLDVKESEAYKNALANTDDGTQTQAFNSREVSRKAIIVSKPEPSYTEDARQKLIKGVVIIKCVFDANGQVNNLRVVRGLPGGLTGKAVEAALSIRYFPAEKDGKRVAQTLQVEYNFNVY